MASRSSAACLRTVNQFDVQLLLAPDVLPAVFGRAESGRDVFGKGSVLASFLTLFLSLHTLEMFERVGVGCELCRVGVPGVPIAAVGALVGDEQFQKSIRLLHSDFGGDLLVPKPHLPFASSPGRSILPCALPFHRQHSLDRPQLCKLPFRNAANHPELIRKSADMRLQARSIRRTWFVVRSTLQSLNEDNQRGLSGSAPPPTHPTCLYTFGVPGKEVGNHESSGLPAPSALHPQNHACASPASLDSWKA